jgi:2,3-bisphosphoglycerate-independent phosphoglycerate mutase
MLMIFIDGIGIGTDDPAINPFSSYGSKVFTLYKENDKGNAEQHEFLESAWIKSVECTMDIPGIPQSATGQTALFTGRNTAKLLNKHLSGFPNRRLKNLLHRESIMVLLEGMGYSVVFANAFTPPYFKRRSSRVSATTAMAESCKTRIRSFKDMEEGKAVFMDLTNQWLIDKGYWVTPRTVEEAANVLSFITKDNDFTLFEYFITDVIGHRGDFSNAIEQVRVLDNFILKVWENLDTGEDNMIITSDHGNLEDVPLRTHTKNRIPIIIAGKRAEALIQNINEITDVTPSILKEFNKISSFRKISH